MTNSVRRRGHWTSHFSLLAGLAFLLVAAVAEAADYPPAVSPSDATPWAGSLLSGGLIFTNTHNYGSVIIKVDVYNNFFGDFTKYHWVYTVTNISYEPNPGSSNGFSGFELALPQFVPDIGDISAPDGIPPWVINCCSGLPVEWDLTNSGGAPVGGGTLPGQTEVYSFTTSPRLITVSTGWFHTWESDLQTFIVNYPSDDAPEVPDVLADPGQELCCYQDSTGGYVCQPLPTGQCESIGGIIVANCNNCPPINATEQKSWGEVKGIYR